jgi:hypothetical protein
MGVSGTGGGRGRRFLRLLRHCDRIWQTLGISCHPPSRYATYTVAKALVDEMEDRLVHKSA